MVVRLNKHGEMKENKEDTTMKNLRIEKMKNISLAALLMAGAAFTACSSSSDDIIEQPTNPTEPQVYTMVIKASKGGDTTTRALKPGKDSNNKNTVDACWSGTETIEVGQYNYDTEKYDIIGTATAAYSPNGNTTITAKLDYAPNPNKDLNFFLGGSTPDYTGQVGLLTGTNSISEKYDYAMDGLGSGSYTVDEINKKIIPGDYEPLEFGAAEQAIIMFTLKDKANNAAISPSAFTVSDGTSTVELTSIPATTYTANGDGVLYVAFPPSGEDKTITLTATIGEDTYTYTTSSTKTFYRGQYYEITVKMTKHVPSLADAFVNGNETKLAFTVSTLFLSGNLSLSATYNNGLFSDVTKDATGMISTLVTDASMAKDGNNLKITVNTSMGNGTMTINTVNNSYSWSNATVGAMITLTTITIGGYIITPLPYKSAASAADSDLGKLICNKGHIHAHGADAECTATRVAMIAYVGSGSNCAHGLALQLNNSPVQKYWADNEAKNYAEGLEAVPGGTWRLPSKADWENMFLACRIDGDESSASVNMTIQGFKEKIAATGTTWTSGDYWSSTANGEEAWSALVFLDGSSASVYFNSRNTGWDGYVLGCLAF